MTLDERVEKGTIGVGRVRERKWDRLDDGDLAAAAIRAAFPELFTDPPTHKIVPLEPTEEIVTAGWNAAYGDDEEQASTADVYRAMIKAVH